MSAEVKRILLIRRKALGDALVTLPAVMTVARAWPRAQIDLIMDRPFTPLLAHLAPEVQVLSWPPEDGSGLVGRLLRAPYDLTVDWLGSPRTALWSVLSGAPRRVGYDLPRRRWAYNIRVPRNRAVDTDLRGFAGEAFLDPLRVLGLQPEPWSRSADHHERRGEADAGLGPTYRRWREEWLQRTGPRAVLVMSATWSAKSWPTRHIAALMDLLQEAGVVPLLAPGPGDEPLIDELGSGFASDRVAPPTTLLELADLLQRADIFLGTDNGARHLAAWLGVPTVTVFGPTDPMGWNPEDPRHVAVTHPVPCAPCNLTECPVAGRPCLEDLTPDLVAQAAYRVLDRRRSRIADRSNRTET